MTTYTISSPLGPITLTEENDHLIGLIFGGTPTAAPAPSPLLLQAQDAISDYFSGKSDSFSIPLELRGTAFQRAVWSALQEIPYGTTCTYSSIAARIGRPTAVRAVAHAIGQNPIGIFVPCHRVIGKNGSLTGFAWGLDIKKALLELEHAI